MMKRFEGVFLAVLAGSLVPASFAQTVPAPPVQGNPYFNYNQNPLSNAAALATLQNAQNAAYASGLNQAAFTSSYLPWNPYYTFQNPYYGYLSGAADVIQSQGQFMIDRVQANLMREQVSQAKTDTRRKAFDEWLYERAHTPTVEEERERARLENLRRSLNDPPITEIWSAKALNDVLLDLQQKQAKRLQGTPVSLDPNTLAHINVTTGVNGGNIGVLRDNGKLQWPLGLSGPAFAKERKLLDQLAPEAVRQARAGAMDAGTLNAMNQAIDTIQSSLKRRVAEIPANQYIDAKRYLSDLATAVTGLQDPNAGKYFNRKWVAKGNNVSDLVTEMSNQGLRFAAATPGDQAAYVALYRAMVDYDTELAMMVARGGAGQP